MKIREYKCAKNRTKTCARTQIYKESPRYQWTKCIVQDKQILLLHVVLLKKVQSIFCRHITDDIWEKTILFNTRGQAHHMLIIESQSVNYTIALR